MRFAPRSIGGRLALGAIVLVSVAIVVSGIGIGIVLQRFIRSQIDQRLDGQIISVISALTVKNGGLELSTNVDAPPFDRLHSGWYWQITSGDQTLRSRSLGAETLEASVDVPLPRMRDLLEGRPRPATGQGPRGEPLHMRIQDHASVGGVAISVIAAAPVHALVGPMGQALVPVTIVLVLLGLFLGIASLMQVRSGLKPLGALKTHLEDVRAGRINHIPTGQPSELMPLIEELNSLIDQNAEGLRRARTHVANLGHALNTPLATLALSLNEDSDGAQANLVAEMQERIRHHLARARVAALSGPAHLRTAIAPRADDIIAALSKIYADKGLKIGVHINGTDAVACEAQDLDEMLGNILDNAFKWATARVDIRTAAVDARISIIIMDDGPGLLDDRLPEALMPGRKLDESIPGHGFGLSITRELAELYGGGIALARSKIGGLEVTISLPVAAPGQSPALPS